MTIPKCIKNIRMTLGLSQSELAHRIEKDKTSICLYESGKRSPGFKTIRRIVDFANSEGMNLKYADLRDE